MSKRKTETTKERGYSDFPNHEAARDRYNKALGAVKKAERRLSDLLVESAQATPEKTSDLAESYLSRLDSDEGDVAVIVEQKAAIAEQVRQVRDELAVVEEAARLALKALNREARIAQRAMKADRAPRRAKVEADVLEAYRHFQQALKAEFLFHNELSRLNIGTSGRTFSGAWVNNIVEGRLRTRTGARP